MTTLVRGPIKLVTDRPDAVWKINLRAPELRLHGAGIVTDHKDDIPVVDGQVEFEAIPGPAVMLLVSGGAPGNTVKLIIPDKETATLRECIEAVQVADSGTQSILDELASSVAQARAEAVEAAASASSSERNAIASEGNASTSETNAAMSETNAAMSEENADEAAAIAALAAAELGHLQGVGPPEGALAAPVGAVYTDTAATAGAVRWIKVSGGGDTGWRVLYGDTGWIVADGWAINGWAGRLRVRRVGDLVEVIVHALDPSAMTGNPSVLFPVGFRPYQSSGSTVRPLLHESDNVSTPRRFYFTTAGELATTTYAKPSVPVYGSFTYTTTEPWITA